jgi:hypothetical protein
MEEKQKQNKTRVISLSFSGNELSDCPQCGEECTKKTSTNYKLYQAECEKMFGENSWPVCFSCYNQGLSCSFCKMIFVKSPLLQETSGCSFPASCNHLTNYRHVCGICVGEKRDILSTAPTNIYWYPCSCWPV